MVYFRIAVTGTALISFAAMSDLWFGGQRRLDTVMLFVALLGFGFCLLGIAGLLDELNRRSESVRKH